MGSESVASKLTAEIEVSIQLVSPASGEMLLGFGLDFFRSTVSIQLVSPASGELST